MKPKGKTRLSMDLSTTAKLNIDNLQKRSGAISMAEVVRRALAVYDLVVTEQSNGSKLIIRNESGNEKEVIFLL